jgi:hypothetical protein
MRPRVAPSAVRTAISPVRVTVRAYTSTATLRQTRTRSSESIACITWNFHAPPSASSSVKISV